MLLQDIILFAETYPYLFEAIVSIAAAIILVKANAVSEWDTVWVGVVVLYSLFIIADPREDDDSETIPINSAKTSNGRASSRGSIRIRRRTETAPGIVIKVDAPAGEIETIAGTSGYGENSRQPNEDLRSTTLARPSSQEAQNAPSELEMTEQQRQRIAQKEVEGRTRTDAATAMGINAAPNMQSFSAVVFGASQSDPSRNNARERPLKLETGFLKAPQSTSTSRDVSPNQEITSPRPLQPRNSILHIDPK